MLRKGIIHLHDNRNKTILDQIIFLSTFDCLRVDCLRVQGDPEREAVIVVAVLIRVLPMIHALRAAGTAAVVAAHAVVHLYQPFS